MQVNDDLFDDEIRKKIKNEIKYIPDDINEKIDDAVRKIEKRRFNVKKVSSICVVCVTTTLLLGMAMPTYASNIPVIGSIFKMFNYKIYENYDKYASDLNITKESNGVRMTINKVVYDGIQISLFYTVESESEINEDPRFPGAELKINGKKTTFGGGGTGKYLNDKRTFVGSMEYNVGKKNYVPKDVQEKTFLGGNVEIPNEFVLSLNIDEIGVENTIKGEWNFNIPVSSEKVNGKVNEQKCDIDLSKISDGYHINKIITTPLNTSIQGIKIDKEDESEYLDFAVFDDKGRYIQFKSAGATGNKDEEGNFVTYFGNNFKEIYDDTESLTFIPYKNSFKESDDTKKEIITKLNLKGETKLYSNDGEEYAAITRIETENGTTKIYYKSKYGINIIPIEITNNTTGEKILSIDKTNDGRKQMAGITYMASSGEYAIPCDKVITEGDYLIKTIDQSKSIEVYNEDKFTIKVK